MLRNQRFWDFFFSLSDSKQVVTRYALSGAIFILINNDFFVINLGVIKAGLRTHGMLSAVENECVLVVNVETNPVESGYLAMQSLSGEKSMIQVFYDKTNR